MTFHSWRDTHGTVEARFFGKPLDGAPAKPADRGQILRRLAPRGIEPAWLEQIHSADVLELDASCAASDGPAGRGDALLARETGRREPGRALAVVTADCVPVLLSGTGEIAAVHAGWRGLVAAVIPAALARLRAPGAQVTAWIGPSIGPCCYEVSDDVAAQVVAASSAPGEDIARPGPRGRPHLDLVAVASAQLAAGGVKDVRRLGGCTRCDVERLWSYRRDGKGTGHNVAMIWIREDGTIHP